MNKTGKADKPGKTAKSYAELSAELEAVLAALQHDAIDVDEALTSYKRGMELVAELEAYLKEAENTVARIKADFKA